MRALTVSQGEQESAALEDVAGVVIRSLCVGVCGTDAEILSGKYGWAPPGRSRLVLGHECVARVEHAHAGFAEGEYVPLAAWQSALERQQGDVKVVIDLAN